MTLDIAQEQITLDRFHPVRHYATHVQDADRLPGLFVDCETTGLDPEVDKIIQLCLVPFTFSKEGIVCTTGEEYLALEDPCEPLSPEITRLTGLTDEMVKDRGFSELRVNGLLDGCELVVAHHAAFDRPFLEKRFPSFSHYRFGCSMADVPWHEEGFTSVKLEWLAFRHLGLFYDSHSADIDCYMGIHLLANRLPSGRRAMDCVLEGARHTYARVFAAHSPFEFRHVLKRRGYRWNDGTNHLPKAWYRDVRVGNDYVEELQWLAAEGGCTQPAVHRFDSRRRFSNRIGR
jgi:DNA polymerase III subunit epsilon